MKVYDINIINSHFIHNSTVHYSGGALCTFQEFNRMLVSNSTFSHNYAKKDEDVLKIHDGRGTIDISGCIFDNNRTDLRGGVFWTVPLRAFNVDNSLFINNHAGSDGGVMNVEMIDQ